MLPLTTCPECGSRCYADEGYECAACIDRLADEDLAAAEDLEDDPEYWAWCDEQQALMLDEERRAS